MPGCAAPAKFVHCLAPKAATVNDCRLVIEGFVAVMSISISRRLLRCASKTAFCFLSPK